MSPTGHYDTGDYLRRNTEKWWVEQPPEIPQANHKWPQSKTQAEDTKKHGKADGGIENGMPRRHYSSYGQRQTYLRCALKSYVRNKGNYTCIVSYQGRKVLAHTNHQAA